MYTQAPLSYNFYWHKLSDDLFRSVIREYLDWGVDKFVLTDPLIKDCILKPERLEFMRKICKEMGVSFISTHAPADKLYDLNITDKERRPQMWKEHIRGMEITSEFGGKTYTIHVGAYYHCIEKVPMEPLRELALETIEKLLPAAEKNGVVLAVENSFEPPNSAKEVLGLITPFLSSPAIGVCYDTGHANMMDPQPWKKKEEYADYMPELWWENGIIEEANAIDILKPHIVTTHIHDNSGYADLHSMPFDGTIDWAKLMPKLRSCPRMLEYQTEICFEYGTNWAGELLAPVGGYSIKKQVETFQKLFA